MNSEQMIVKYLQFKKIQDLGFVKYSVFRRIIMYLLDVHDNNYLIRKTFLKLVEKNYFYKKSNSLKKSYRYKFNSDRFIKQSDRIEKIKFPIIIHFD